jgi:hypothetical protein
MKIAIATLAVLSGTCATGVFAQAVNFEGASVGINYNAVNSTATGAGFGLTGRDQALSLNGKYTKAMSNDYTLGASLDLGLGQLQSGSGVKGTGHYSFALEAGVATSASMLVFGEISFNGVKRQVANNGLSQSDDFTGIGYGIGLRNLISKNVYWQAALLKRDYNDMANAGTYNTTGLALGAGYKF